MVSFLTCLFLWSCFVGLYRVREGACVNTAVLCVRALQLYHPTAGQLCAALHVREQGLRQAAALPGRRRPEEKAAAAAALAAIGRRVI